jgi:hypothetical protein
MVIKISKKDFKKIMDYAKASVEEFRAEIGGMATLVLTDDGYQIKNPVILKQTVTGSSCTLDKEELANYYTRTMKKVGTDISFVWWHSHGSGSTFWSGTDETAIKEYSGGKWSVSLVVNADEEYKLRVDWFIPKHASLEDTELEVVGEDNCVIPKAITNEVKELCSKPVYNTVKSNYNSKQTSLLAPNGYGYDYGYCDTGYENTYGSYGTLPREPSGNAVTSENFHLAINDINDALTDYECSTLKYNELRKVVKIVNKSIEQFGFISLPRKKYLDSYQIHNSPLADAIQMFRTNSK